MMDDDVEFEMPERNMVFLLIKRKKQTLFQVVRPDETVYGMKQLISGLFRALPENQQLHYNDQIMEDDRDLAYYSVTPENSMSHDPVSLGLSIRQANGEFEPLDITPYSESVDNLMLYAEPID